jgi:hypothetical protein
MDIKLTRKEINEIKRFRKEQIKQHEARLDAFANEVFMCECGTEYTRAKRFKHRMTNNHYNTILKLQQQTL